MSNDYGVSDLIEAAETLAYYADKFHEDPYDEDVEIALMSSLDDLHDAIAKAKGAEDA